MGALPDNRLIDKNFINPHKNDYKLEIQYRDIAGNDYVSIFVPDRTYNDVFRVSEYSSPTYHFVERVGKT